MPTTGLLGESFLVVREDTRELLDDFDHLDVLPDPGALVMTQDGADARDCHCWRVIRHEFIAHDVFAIVLPAKLSDFAALASYLGPLADRSLDPRT